MLKHNEGNTGTSWGFTRGNMVFNIQMGSFETTLHPVNI